MRWLRIVRIVRIVLLVLLVLLVSSTSWAQEDDDDKRLHTYLGGVAGGLLPVIWNNGGAGMQFGVRGGFLVHGFQVQLEIAPATGIFAVARDPMALMDATASIGYLVPMSDMVSWIVRFGGGGGALFNAQVLNCGPPNFTCMTTTSTVGFGEVRIDVAGVAIRTSKHLLVECNAPSFRMMFFEGSAGRNVMFTWVTNVGIDYLF